MIYSSSEPQQLLTDHLLTHPHALGFVGVGIGKTAATLDAIDQLFTDGETRGVLVLAPMRVANLTWPMEVHKWSNFSWMKVANLRTQAGKRAFLLGKAHIYVCNFEGIPMLLKLVKQLKSKGKKLPYDTLVVDELTKTRNPSSKRAQAYRAFVPHSEHKRKWGLTGTPAPNSLLDLFAQVRFIDNGERLGPAFTLFKEAYFKQSGYGGYKWVELPGSKDRIEEKIADITLTLRSKDWLDIPDTIVDDVEIHMPAALLKEYKDFEKELVMEIKESKAEITAANAAALVSKLLQFTSGAIYDSEKVWHAIHDLKIKELTKVAKKVGGPVLVACAFRHEQQRIRQNFPQARFFEDAKNSTSQMELLNAWNAGKIPMLVAHPRSVGHGLNMQGNKGVSVNNIVWFTLTYSREDYEQMIARLARRGQEEITYVHRLMCSDTVDYTVATVIEEKKATEDRLLSALQLLESYWDVGPKKLKIIEEVEDWV